MKKVISFFLAVVASVSMTLPAMGWFEYIYPKPRKRVVENQITEQIAEPTTVKVYIGRFKIYGYDACASCCGKTDGITKSGTQATAGRTVAAPNQFDFGDVLYIDGIGERIVEDRGYLASNVIDVFCNNHTECYAVTGWYDVYKIVEVS